LKTELAAVMAGEVARFVHLARQAAAGQVAGLVDVFEEAARAAAARIGQQMIAGAANLVACSTPPVTQCGQGHPTGVHCLRSKTITTMLGTVAVTRAYHYCRACRDGFYPADVVLGIDRKTTSIAVDKAVTAAGREIPFARAADLIGEITGQRITSTKTTDRITKRSGRAGRALIEADTAAAITGPVGVYRRRWEAGTTACVLIDGTGLPMVPSETAGRVGKQPDGSSKTKEAKIGRFVTHTGYDKDGHPVLDPGSTSYVATFDAVGAFTIDIAAEAVRRDFAHAPRTCVIADGATWIWKLVDGLWPNASQIVDYYHAAEHVHDLGEQLKPYLPDGVDPARFTTGLKDHLYAGRIQDLADQARSVSLPDQATSGKVATAIGYFTKNWFRMQYATFREQGLLIGSGAVEAACKSLAEARAAQSGMRWTIRGADPVLALRALHRSTDNPTSPRYEQIWDRFTPQTPVATGPHQQT
jgi:hypothetical protein